MQERSVMGAHPRRGEDVGPEFLACDGAGGGGFDLDGALRRDTPPRQPLTDRHIGDAELLRELPSPHNLNRS